MKQASVEHIGRSQPMPGVLGRPGEVKDGRMTVETQELRDRYTSLATDELRRIVSSGQYTAQARDAASAVLASRRFERPSGTESPPAERRRQAGWWPLSFLGLLLGHFANEIFGAAKRSGLTADGMLQFANAVLRSPWTYAIGVAGLVVLWRRNRAWMGHEAAQQGDAADER